MTRDIRSRAGGGSAFTAVLLSAGLCGLSAPPQAQESEKDPTFDGLVRVEDAKVDLAYLDPEADFSVYRRVMLLEPEVAFRRNWLRDQRRSARGTARLTEADAEQIREDVAALLLEVFVEVLEEKEGYEVVDERGEDVLLVRPAIVDLDVTAPDMSMRSAGRVTTFTTTAGSATLYIELYDSVTRDILGRAADRKTTRGPGSSFNWTRSNRVTNVAEARRLFRGWARQLRTFLDSHYAPAS